ncbi:hypothetical protein KGF57_002991 [Candida theae]|uniref:Uncharacterized protein n=1 Tax=Candida theae TaxID=1198502 RepID=A0AAD5BEK9_9ASCO|nr:uncharacterized protein KGF57_002991 [Candida theae]KAI5957725.1 hypothetical protein KGF57_002991 [Candida theae]
MSSSSFSSGSSRGCVVVDAATPTTAIPAAATPNGSDPLPPLPHPPSIESTTPQSRCNDLPNQFHQFFNDNSLDLLVHQVHDLKSSTIEGQRQIRAVMNMFHFLSECKREILDSLVTIKSILEAKSGEELQSIRNRLNYAVAKEEIYSEVVGLFEYIVSTPFDENDRSSQWEECDFDVAEECEEYQLQNIELSAARNLSAMRKLVRHLNHEVHSVAPSTGNRDSAREMPRERQPNVVDTYGVVLSFELVQDPQQQFEPMVEGTQIPKIEQIKEIEETEDESGTGVAKGQVAEIDSTKSSRVEAVENSLQGVNQVLEEDLTEFAGEVSKHVVGEAINNVEAAAKVNVVAPTQIDGPDDVNAQSIVKEIVTEVVRKVGTESIAEIIGQAVHDSIAEAIGEEKEAENSNQTVTPKEKIADDAVVANVVGKVAEKLASGLLEHVEESLVEEFNESVSDVPSQSITTSNGQEIECVAEKASRQEHQAFTGSN